MEAALRNRLVFGSIMLASLAGVLWLDWAIEQWTREWARTQLGMSHGIGGIGLAGILILVTPLATRELAVLFTAVRVQPHRLIAGLGSGALLLHAFLTQFPFFKPIAASSVVFIVVCTMLAAALRRAMQKQTQDAIVAMAGTVLSTLYLGGLGWFLMALRVKHGEASGFEGSTSKIVMILLCVKFTDIGAYFGGRSLGRHKLIPWLSPGKTWEGLICGLATAGVVGVIAATQIEMLVWWKGLIFGVIIGGVGQLGDLLESLMKRDAEVKDSGNSIPGFGGVLDVIDSPLLAAPVAYLLFSLF
jgi:phosphatidate cytidylyltransferase